MKGLGLSLALSKLLGNIMLKLITEGAKKPSRKASHHLLYNLMFLVVRTNKERLRVS